MVSQSSSSPSKPQWSVEQRYADIRAQVETPEQIGKLIIIDLDSGDYEIDLDSGDLGIEASRRLQTRHPGASLHARRIGYQTAASFCGSLERTQT